MKWRSFAWSLLLLAPAGCVGLRANVEHARELRERGDAAYRSGDYQGAIGHYSEAIAHNPEFAEAYFWRGNAYSSLPQQDPRSNTRDSMMKAAADYTEAISRNPAHFDSYWNRAVVAAYFKQYRAAVKDFLQCVQLRPNDPEPHLRIGEIYETRFEDMGLRAMEHYEQYVRLGGKSHEVLDKVKAWQAAKGQAAPSVPKGPTPQDEERAKSLHGELMTLLGQGKKDEAFRALDDLLTRFGHTEYVKARTAAFGALHQTLKPTEKK